MPAFKNGELFSLEYQGTEYPTRCIERNGVLFYAVKMDTTVVYLHKATAINAQPFWTSIPEAPKLQTLVQQLGIKIDNYLIQP